MKGIREPGNRIKIQRHYDSFNEAQYIAYSIKSIVASGVPFDEIAVFYRLQRQSKELEDVFKRESIPYEVSIRKTVKDFPVLSWFIQLLRSAVNPHDIESTVAVLSNDFYGEHLGKREARIVSSSLKNPDLSSSLISSDQIRMFEESETDAAVRVPPLLQKIEAFQKWCETESSIMNAYDYFEIDSYINPTAFSFLSDQRYIKSFLKRIADYIHIKQMDIYSGVKEFVNSAALYGINVLSEDVHETTNKVKLMTLHAAKGLEFRYVYIIGVNDGLIPLLTKSEDEEKEEMRLFFVGITRAKDYLELSYYTNPDETRVFSGPSKYISYIPQRLIDHDAQELNEVDLQQYRHEVSEHMGMEEPVEDDDYNPFEHFNLVEDSPPVSCRMVRHPKYGVGTVISEDENMITVSFDGFGEKEFIKAFSELEDVE